MKQKILLIEPQNIIAQNIRQKLVDYDVLHVTSAREAIAAASEEDVVAVICELSLGGHSGFEFLYEFRSYSDWADVPIIVYSTVRLDREVLRSRSWQALKIHDYVYKPAASLESLKSSLEKASLVSTL